MHKITPNYILTHQPALRLAFYLDLFDEKGELIENVTIYKDCSCGNKHKLGLNLPVILEGAPEFISQSIKQLKIAMTQLIKVELKWMVEAGELYVSENNIGFQIKLNLN